MSAAPPMATAAADSPESARRPRWRRPVLDRLGVFRRLAPAAPVVADAGAPTAAHIIPGPRERLSRAPSSSWRGPDREQAMHSHWTPRRGCLPLGTQRCHDPLHLLLLLPLFVWPPSFSERSSADRAARRTARAVVHRVAKALSSTVYAGQGFYCILCLEFVILVYERQLGWSHDKSPSPPISPPLISLSFRTGASASMLTCTGFYH